MDIGARPYRSVLYIPGSNSRALEKAKTLSVDAIIFDLEDAVAQDAKTTARHTLAEALIGGGYGKRARIVRINGFDTEWGADDLDMMAEAAPDAILLPKVGSAADIEGLAAKLDLRPQMSNTMIWAMIESPAGVLNAAAIAAAPRMAGLVMGTNDLEKDLSARFRADRLPMMMSLQMCLLAARASGIVIVDGVYNAFKDDEGLRAEAEQGRDLGFDGKTLIHPAQVAIANEIFAPDAEELDLARRQIEAFAAAEKNGQGVAVVDGKIVENLHIVTARRTLSRAEAIAEMENI